MRNLSSLRARKREPEMRRAVRGLLDFIESVFDLRRIGFQLPWHRRSLKPAAAPCRKKIDAHVRVDLSYQLALSVLLVFRHLNRMPLAATVPLVGVGGGAGCDVGVLV